MMIRADPAQILAPRLPVLSVCGERSKIKMGRVHAPSIVAGVANNLFAWYFSVDKFPHEAMGLNILPVHVEVPAPVVFPSSDPWPALVFPADIHLRPKAILWASVAALVRTVNLLIAICDKFFLTGWTYFHHDVSIAWSNRQCKR